MKRNDFNLLTGIRRTDVGQLVLDNCEFLIFYSSIWFMVCSIKVVQFWTERSSDIIDSYLIKNVSSVRMYSYICAHVRACMLRIFLEKKGFLC